MMEALKNLIWNLKMRFKRFPGSREYWETRYATGGNSGPGSYTRFAEYKAGIMNALIQEHGIRSAVEFGCGDGNQLSMIHYPQYLGLDVARTAVEDCRRKFAGDGTRSFAVYDAKTFGTSHPVPRADLGVSMDVLFHLVEEDVFETYLKHLFAASERIVVIYARDVDGAPTFHEHNRSFTGRIARLAPGWELNKRIESPFRSEARTPEEASNVADFFVFKKTA